MEPSLDLQAIAQEIRNAQQRGIQIEPFTSRFPNFSNTEAYIVADLIHQTLRKEGATPLGRKIGFTNPEMWAIYGVHEPIWAYVYDTTVIQLSEAHAQCSMEGFTEPKIEPEIVLHFHSTPQPGANPVEILECIDWIAHGMEIVQSHFPGWEFQAADSIADSSLHAKLLVGKPCELNQLGPEIVSDLETFEVTLSCNGKVCERGRGSNALGSPLYAIAYLVDVLASQPEASPLQPGELVTTGTLTAAPPIRAGQEWSTSITGIGLPEISLSITE
jgi:2-oxo-3-hexenedioate decarboxylase